MLLLETSLKSLINNVTSSNMSTIDGNVQVYTHSIVNVALYCTVSGIFSIFCRKTPFFNPLLFHPKIGELPVDLDCCACRCGEHMILETSRVIIFNARQPR